MLMAIGDHGVRAPGTELTQAVVADGLKVRLSVPPASLCVPEGV